MKISGLEKGILALTAAFLLLTVGYFLGRRGGGEPYSVSAQTLWIEEAAAQETKSAQRVNINTAGAEELQELPGIGQARAEAIVADREANGPFRFPEEIARVSGMGQGTLEDILDNITVE
ncbi:MAG: ComEA family DNA-binding protein [Oscillospiraceae bacterium]